MKNQTKENQGTAQPQQRTTELILITEQDGKRAVNARDLHAFFESKQDFSTWIKNRIRQYDFIEDVDFTLHKIVERGNSGAQTKIEYALTINMAKELSMVENNAKGKQARRYFIECEERIQQLPMPTQCVQMIADGIAQLVETSLRQVVMSMQLPQLPQQPTQICLPQRFDFKGMLSYVNGQGYTLSKSAGQKKAAAGDIPCYKFNNRLVFEKSELDAWLESQTTKTGNKSNTDLMLARSANRKLKFKKVV